MEARSPFFSPILNKMDTKNHAAIKIDGRQFDKIKKMM
jgi:hypothetical protein